MAVRTRLPHQGSDSLRLEEEELPAKLSEGREGGQRVQLPGVLMVRV